MLTCAVVGSGATACGVLDALANRADIHVTLIHPPASPREALCRIYGQGEDATPSHSDILRAVWKVHGAKFPPPKTHFGLTAETLPVRNWSQVWASNLRGGLTTFWGGAAVPFADEDFAVWPIGRQDLEPHYVAMARRIGITGSDDALRVKLRDDFANLPQIKPVAPIRILVEGLQHHTGSPDVKVYAGVARLAIETRADRPNCCTYTGDCLIGCRRHAIFSAGSAIDHWLSNGVIASEIQAVVRSFDPVRRTVRVSAMGGQQELGPFDRVFLCAGCLHSCQILMRSFNLTVCSPISDNAVFNFPIIYSGSERDETFQGYLALSNGLIRVEFPDNDLRPVSIQLYPSPDYFWQYWLPRWLDAPLKGPAAKIRARLFWGRVYVHGTNSQHYEFVMENGEPIIRLRQAPDISLFHRRIWPKLRRLLTRGPFWIPPIPPLRSSTSSHYAGGFPLGSELVDAGGRISDGLFLCDPASFPDCPSLSHTFTGMANARRIASQAIT